MPSGHSSQVSFIWLVAPAGTLRYTVTPSVAQLCLTLSDPMDCSRLLCPWDYPGKNTFPLPGNLPNLGTEPISPVPPALAGRFLYH